MQIVTLKTFLLVDTKTEEIIIDLLLLTPLQIEGEMMSLGREAAAETEAMLADPTPKTLVVMIAETRADMSPSITLLQVEGSHPHQTGKICRRGRMGATDPTSETIARGAAVVSLETTTLTEGVETEATSRDVTTRLEIEKTSEAAIAAGIEATLEVASEAWTVGTSAVATEAISAVVLEETEAVTEEATEVASEAASVAIAVAIEVASEEALEAAEAVATMTMTWLLRPADSTQAKSKKPLAWLSNSLPPNTVLAMAKVLRSMAATSKCSSNIPTINSSLLIKLQLLQARILLLSI